MIYVDAETRIIMVHGAHTMEAIEQAVLHVTERERWTYRKRWVIVGIADERSLQLTTGMPFSPPDDRAPVGFRRDK